MTTENNKSWEGDNMSDRDKLDLILERLEEVSLKQASMAEIILAWNNAKGFVNTVRWLSKVTLWVAPVAALWYAFTNGKWPS